MGSDIVKTMLRKIDWRTANDGEDVGLDGGVLESVGLTVTGLVGTCETEGRSPGEEAESAVEERRTDSDCDDVCMMGSCLGEGQTVSDGQCYPLSLGI